MPKISVSFLSTDYSDRSMLEQTLMRISNADMLHFDIMDGKFVKQKTYGADMVDVKTALQKDVHLMVKSPERYIKLLAKHQAKIVTFHIEAAKSPKKLIEAIHAQGMLAGIALKPKTAVSKIDRYLESIDLVLIMTVEPGKGGQKMLKTPLKKIRAIKKKKPSILISVDGGVNAATARLALEAGADILVAGSYVFSQEPALAIDVLRNS